MTDAVIVDIADRIDPERGFGLRGGALGDRTGRRLVGALGRWAVDRDEQSPAVIGEDRERAPRVSTGEFGLHPA